MNLRKMYDAEVAQVGTGAGSGAAIINYQNVRASADLNCDGIYSLYQRSVVTGSQYTVQGGAGLYIVNDIE